MYLMDTLPSEQIINADKQILNNTDYNMLKAFEYVLQAESLPDLLVRLESTRKDFKETIKLRQHCREEINAAEITLLEEQAARDAAMQEYLAQQQIEELPLEDGPLIVEQPSIDILPFPEDFKIELGATDDTDSSTNL